MAYKVVTANRLDDGLAVFFHKEGQWHTQLDLASMVESPEEAEKLLKSAETAENQLLVVGPYLIDVESQEGRCMPLRYREKIRTLGPSVRPDLGYQAEQ